MEGSEPLEGIVGRCGEIALVRLSSRDELRSGCRIPCCGGGGAIDDVRGGWTGVGEGSGGGGVSTICGTGLRSKEVAVAGGDLAGGGDFRISGMLAVLDRFISSLLNIGSNVDGPEELTPTEDEVAGLEKFVGEDLARLGPFEGSFRVCAKFGTSMDKSGRGGIAGTPVSGDSGRLPDGLPATPLLAARWA